jgi:hypothetical protein
VEADIQLAGQGAPCLQKHDGNGTSRGPVRHAETLKRGDCIQGPSLNPVVKRREIELAYRRGSVIGHFSSSS